MSSEKATLTVGDKVIELQMYSGSEGQKAIDISGLFDQHGLVTFDPSLGSTAVCRSEITYIDGDQGILRYRGIPIEQFDRPKPNFIEVAMLLINGKLPTKPELSEFSNLLTENELIDEGIRRQFNNVPPKSPPMAILSAMLSQLACYHEKFLPLGDDELFIEAAARLISKVRTIAAFSYRRSKGLPFTYPDPELRYCANFLHMMFSIPHKQYKVPKEIEDALNLILILHADHEQNCSTATVRVIGSARANLFAACAGGVNALWGPLHGGANVEVMKMLDQIHKGGLSAKDCIEAAKDKTNPFKLYGFGHRVYKNYDPRAKMLRECADRVFTKLEQYDPLLDIARELEELALSDPYFVDRKLYPNVDFYSGILLRAMGIPTNMFTVLFGIGRLPGWIAQWKELHDTENSKIIRPRQLYIGNNITEYIEIEER
ncbi:MAG: citrate synthase [Thermoguttaceae bacterium]